MRMEQQKNKNATQMNAPNPVSTRAWTTPRGKSYPDIRRTHVNTGNSLELTTLEIFGLSSSLNNLNANVWTISNNMKVDGIQIIRTHSIDMCRDEITRRVKSREWGVKLSKYK